MKRLLLVTLLAPSLAWAMEQSPQPTKSHLESLPGDVQRYLLPFVLSTVSIRADLDTLFSLACANKYLNAFINHEDTLKYIITICANNHSWYDEVSIAHYMQNMHGMKTPGMQEWVLKRKKEIVLEKDLLIATGNDDPKSIVRVNELLSQGVNPNVRCRVSGRTPLLNATILANTQMMNTLLNAGANLNLRTGDPLFAAVYKKRKDLVELLLKAKADVNIADQLGLTPLMKAAKYGPIEIVQILLTAGARVDLRSNQYGTALELARKEGNIEIEQLLLAHENRKTMAKKQ